MLCNTQSPPAGAHCVLSLSLIPRCPPTQSPLCFPLSVTPSSPSCLGRLLAGCVVVGVVGRGQLGDGAGGGVHGVAGAGDGVGVAAVRWVGGGEQEGWGGGGSQVDGV